MAYSLLHCAELLGKAIRASFRGLCPELQGSGKDGSNVVGRAARLTDLIAYQEGSVVSRTIMDKGSGTLTLFAFDEGQGLSEHTAPFDAFVHNVDGWTHPVMPSAP